MCAILMHWTLKRIIRSLFTIFIVVNLSFLLIQYLPGGPMDYIRLQLAHQGDYTEEEMQALAQAYININPEAPLSEQYIDYMTSLLQGDLGTSVYYNDSVISIYAEALPWTAFLLGTSVLVTFTLGISLGAYLAYVEGSKMDAGATIYSIISNSIPYYIIAVVFIFFLGNILGWFPITGRYDESTTVGLNPGFILGIFHHAFLPAISLILSGMGGWALAMRGNSIRVLGEDYMRVGDLRGLPSRVLTIRYVARNAILPLYTNLMISLGYVFGGSVVLETIFVYRGVGYYLYQGVISRDYPLMMGGFIIITFTVITAVFIAELTYGKIDPRAQEGGKNETY